MNILIHSKVELNRNALFCFEDKTKLIKQNMGCSRKLTLYPYVGTTTAVVKKHCSKWAIQNQSKALILILFYGIPSLAISLVGNRVLKIAINNE